MYIYAPPNGPRVFPYSVNQLKRDQNISIRAGATGEQLSRVYVYPVLDIKPEYNPKKERLVLKAKEDFQELDGVYYTDYDIVPLTEQEFNRRQSTNIDQAVIKKLLQKQFEQLIVPDNEINDYASLFPAFKVGESVVAGDKRQYEDEVWQVIQSHTTQLDWLPPDVPALWGKVYSPDVIPLWVQPYGAGDPNIKHIGDKVQWPEGTIWVSTVNDNVWEPGVHGWEAE